MTVRKLPGTLTIGLLASLVGHAALYGGEHTVGGAYHALLLQVSLAAAAGFVTLIGAFAWIQSGSIVDGTVLATRLRQRLPPLAGVIAAATAWYVAIELTEPHHKGVPAIALLVTLVAASYAVLRLAHAITAILARFAITASIVAFSPRSPEWRRRPGARPFARRSVHLRRRFARPPPIAFAFPRA